jgi:predicted enzyme related to lactoylglutathione lyase
MTQTQTEAIPQTAPQTTAATSRQPRNPHTAVWFELPVSDLARSARFYEQVFQTRLLSDPRFPEMAIFPRRESSSITGALIQIHNGGLTGRASTDGTVIYLSCDGQLDAVVKRACAAGARLLEEVAQLPAGIGWTAQIQDIDGNRVGLHAAF